MILERVLILSIHVVREKGDVRDIGAVSDKALHLRIHKCYINEKQRRKTLFRLCVFTLSSPWSLATFLRMV